MRRLPRVWGKAPRPRLLRTRTRYAAQLRRPIDENLAVYCAYWGRGYACNPAAIHAKARELAPHIRGCSSSRRTRWTGCPRAWTTR